MVIGSSAYAYGGGASVADVFKNFTPEQQAAIQKAQDIRQAADKEAKFLKTSIEKLFNDLPVEEIFPEFSTGLTNKLWAKRREMGIKQYDMAKKLKVSTPFLSKVELGLLEPTEEFKQLASKVFKMEQSELFLATVQY
jgi:DNA-binding XRE family transcriptional regulator